MFLFLNMCSKVVLGNIILNNVNSIEISENILEMSNTAKITIPYNYAKLNEKPILEQFKVGNKVSIQAGYEGNLKTEFVGYIKEIETERPIIIHCEDETYPLRQTNYIKSYQSATLKQVLTDVIPKDLIKIECPDMNLGKFQIDNASAFAVLQNIMSNYGLYSRLQDSLLTVGLAYDFGKNTKNHTYYMNEPLTVGSYNGNVKKSDLKYKRKEDFKVRYKATANNSNGKKTTVIVGNKDGDASERTLNFAGSFTEKELKEKAESVMKKTVYDGYTGNITGFGFPRTHAGDSLTIKNHTEPQKNGTYLIEKVEITFNENGFSRENELTFKI